MDGSVFGFNPSVVSSEMGSDSEVAGIMGQPSGRQRNKQLLWHAVRGPDLIMRHTVKGLRGNARHTGVSVACVSAQSGQQGERTMAVPEVITKPPSKRQSIIAELKRIKVIRGVAEQQAQ